MEMGIGPATKLSELRKIAAIAPVVKPSMLARSIAQSLRVEGYSVTDDEIEKLILNQTEKAPTHLNEK